MLNRRSVLHRLGGSAIALPALEATQTQAGRDADEIAPVRFLVVGNPFGAHPDHFFPDQYGKDYRFPQTIRSLEWYSARKHSSISVGRVFDMPSGSSDDRPVWG